MNTDLTQVSTAAGVPASPPRTSGAGHACVPARDERSDRACRSPVRGTRERSRVGRQSARGRAGRSEHAIGVRSEDLEDALGERPRQGAEPQVGGGEAACTLPFARTAA